MKKIKNLWKLLAAGGLLLVGLLLFAPASEASAASITQTGATTSTIKIKWDQIDNATSFEVYIRDYYDTSGDYTLAGKINSNAVGATITGLIAGKKYDIRVNYEYVSSYGNTYSSWMSLYGAVTLPGKVTGLKEDKWYYYINQYNASWTRQTGAIGYEYIVYKNNGKKFTSGKTTSYSCTIVDVSNSMTYKMKVRAYTTLNGKTYYGSWSNIGYFFTQPQVKKITAKSGKLTIKWGKVAGMTSYRVYVSTKSNSGYKKVKTVGKNKSSITIKKFKNKKIKKNKTYYVYVIGVKKTSSGTYTSGATYYWYNR